MTVTQATRIVKTNGNGTTAEFFVTFGFYELEVVVNGVAKTLGVDYEISQTAPGRTGSVIFKPGSIPPVGEGNVLIRGNTAIEQPVDYTENNQFPAETIEQALDRLTMICAESNNRVLQSIRNTDLGDEVPALDFAANPLTILRIGATGIPELVEPAFLAGAVYDAVIEARDDAVAAQAAAEAAKVAAELAETHAETAETNAETAETSAATSATNAAASATNASNSATAASGAATAAATSETNAANSASDAYDSAVAAAASALAAAGSASSASTSAGNAATSATNASNSASAASTSATNAASSATAADTAKTAAQTAETNAETAQAAAEAAQAAAEAAVGSLNMPVISSGDAGKSIVVNNTENGFTLNDTTNQRTFDITVQFDGGSSPITNGVKGYVPVDFSGTIIGWTLVGDQSGSMVVDVWKDTYTNYPPTVADTITASAKPTISTSLKGKSSTLTGWTTSFSAGDVFGFNIDSNSAIKFATLSLHCIKA